MTNIKVVLFDADGVIQTTPQTWRSRLEALVGDPGKVTDFLADVFEAEKPCLTGRGDFSVELGKVLDRWHCQATVEEALEIWTIIEPDQEILDVVLATNQQNHRATIMTNLLGYSDLFDELFFSCHLGYAKPDPEYFLQIMARLNLNTPDGLFLDDHLVNVQGAKGAGLHAEVYNLQSGADDLCQLLTGYGIAIS